MNILVIGKAACGIGQVAEAISAAIPGSVLHKGVREIHPLCTPVGSEGGVVVGLQLEDWEAAPHLRIAAANNEFPLKFDRVVLVVRDFRDEMVERLLTFVGTKLRVDQCDPRARAWLADVRRKEKGEEPNSFTDLVTRLNQHFGRRYTPITGADHAVLQLLRARFPLLKVVRYEELLVNGPGALVEALGHELSRHIRLQDFPCVEFQPIEPGSWKHFFTQDDIARLAEPWAPFLKATNCDDWKGSGAVALPNAWSSLVACCLDQARSYTATAKSGSAPKAASTPRRILYVHVAKTGGSTLNDFVVQNMPGAATRLHVESDPAWEAHSRWPELGKYAFVSGHVSLPAYAARLALRDYVRIATFREPARHLVSHIAWVRHLSEPGNERFFAGHPSEVQEMSRRLAALDLADPNQVAEFVQSLDGYAVGLFDNAQCRYLLQIPHRSRVAKLHVDEAVCRLGMLDIVGLTEEMDRTLAVVASRMGWPAPTTVSQMNIGTRRYGMNASDPAFVEAVQPAIWGDLLLYAEARKRFLESYAKLRTLTVVAGTV